ncbi:MAG: ribosome-associated translation inhibitor RaiA [Pseudoflavonifractor sp.]|nr:ribosome-associated translation inhibitor RaiA [Alloprevotella sp.]MCM1117054.1 ribosome-associated translation inhibitor RaiA [Pseudoflavonifractor sp.]
METTVNAVHFDISERLTDFVKRKADRLARRFVDIMGIDATLRVVKPETAMNKEAVVKVDLPGSPEIVATKVADSFEEAIDLCMEALDHQLERIKGRK